MKEKILKLGKWIFIFFVISTIADFLNGLSLFYLAIIFPLLFDLFIYFYILFLLEKRELLEIKIILFLIIFSLSISYLSKFFYSL